MRIAIAAVSVVLAGALLDAHVTVVPSASQTGATERYTVRVPTEGQVTTTSVELEVPAGVTITEVVPGSTYTFDTRREAGRIVAITWKEEIPPKARGEYTFTARNPIAPTTVAWKARQRFADGSSADWIGVEGDRRPASVTTITSAK